MPACHHTFKSFEIILMSEMRNEPLLQVTDFSRACYIYQDFCKINLFRAAF